MIKILLWLWQFPQNLLGFILTRKYRFKSIRKVKGRWIDVYFKPLFNSGISLGDYIIVDYRYCGKRISTEIVNHEHGHHRQSLILGWFYLLLVGIPSICRNIWDRLFHKGWTNDHRKQWYYKGYPERWADILGDVIRD